MLLKTSELTAALKAYQLGQPHSLMALGTTEGSANYGKPVATRHLDGRGLYLNVSASGAMSWVFMYVVNGKRRELGLGSFTGKGRISSLSLAEARDKADQCRVQLQNPTVDLVKDRRAAKEIATITFAKMFEQHADACIKGNVWLRGEKEKKHWEGQLNKNAKALMAMQIGTVTTADIVNVLAPVWPSRLGTQLRQRITAIFKTAKGRGHIETNPADKDVLDAHLMGKHVTKHHEALPFDKMSDFLARLLNGGTVAELCLAFIAFTAVRSGEARLAKRSEIVGNRWTIPAERMGKSTKGGAAPKPHVVLLPKQAMAILARLPQDGAYLFPGKDGEPVTGNDLDDLIEDMGLRGVTTVHGLRGTFDTYMSQLHDEQTGAPIYDAQTIGFCLAHVLKGTDAAYRRETNIKGRGIIMQVYADHATGRKPVALKAVA